MTEEEKITIKMINDLKMLNEEILNVMSSLSDLENLSTDEKISKINNRIIEYDILYCKIKQLFVEKMSDNIDNLLKETDGISDNGN